MACIVPPVPEDVIALDLEADAGLGLSDNDPVADWADQSGVGNSATQGTGANQPTFKSADGPGSRPCILFDGTTDFLELPDITSQRFTLFAVLKPANSSLHSIVCGAAGALQYRTDNSLKQATTVCNGTNLGTGDTALSTSVFQQINVRWDGSASIFRLNSAADGLDLTPASFISPINRIGINGATLGEFFAGSICMIRIYLEVLALDQVEAIEAEITTRWGV